MDELKKVEPPDFDEWAKQYVFYRMRYKNHFNSERISISESQPHLNFFQIYELRYHDGANYLAWNLMQREGQNGVLQQKDIHSLLQLASKGKQ